MSDHDTYERWIKRCKRIEAPAGFADNTVRHAAQRAVAADASPGMLTVVAASRAASFAVCSAALLIGLVPFVYVAYLARLIDF